MKLLNLFTIAFALIISGTVYGQKIKVVSGDLSKLKDIGKVISEYDYSNLKVGKLTEEEYLVKRSGEMNEDEAGKGDKWKEEWESDKENKYKVKFEELFAEHSENIKIEDGADVTMLIETTFIDPGYNVGVSRRPSYVDLTITFKKGDEELVQMTVYHAPGNAAMGYDFDAGLRIGESYAKAGK